MSYARWSPGSSVYVFADSAGGVTCCGCLLDDDPEGFGGWASFYDVTSLIAHFQEHVAAGHKVPTDLLEEDTYEPSDFERRQ